MRHKLLLTIFCALCWLLPARAQFIPGGLFEKNQGSVLVKVLEQGSDKPVPYASAYLTAKNDTLITNFTLTDTTGVARITKVTRGTYVLTVEMLGYKSYNKEHYFSFSWERDSVDLGTVYLSEDAELLDAAHVTAIGNPIEVKQDTIIFNAASFRVGENSMLEDLLKRMPGMEVSKDGTVKYNGETIQKITVGGKTFFFDDPKMALKNLPAKVVDKVKVIDKVSDSEQFTGVATDREKVMDLEFKQEFKEGWFGNISAGLGTTLAGDRKEEMVDDRGLLYNTNGMVFATLSVPISDWWGGTHAVRKAKIQRLQAENDRMEAREKLAIDIQSAWNNMEEAYKQIDIARASVVSAKENLRMLRIFFGAGTTTMTDLLDAVTLFTQSESQLVTACATYQLRVAEYLRKT